MAGNEEGQPVNVRSEERKTQARNKPIGGQVAIDIAASTESELSNLSDPAAFRLQKVKTELQPKAERVEEKKEGIRESQRKLNLDERRQTELRRIEESTGYKFDRKS